MSRITEDEKKRLCVEIFELTGHKVDADDPLIAAALFYSATMRAVAIQNQQAVDTMLGGVEARLHTCMQAAIDRIEGSCKRSIAMVVSELRDGAIANLRSELHSTQPNQVHSPILRTPLQPVTGAPARRSKRTEIGFVGLIAICAFVSGILWGRPGHSAVDLRALKLGQALLTIFPSLDDVTKQKLTEELKKNERSTSR
jgi:hypothetical protein